MKSLLFILFSTILFILLDLFVTLISFALYRKSFSIDLIPNIFLLKDGFHDFVHSGLDFAILYIFRVLILIFCIILWCKKVLPNFSLLFFGINVFNWGFSLTKLLAFSEDTSQLSFFGIWMSIIWNILSYLAVWAIWSFVICSKFSIEAITRRLTSTSEDRENLIETDNSEEKKPIRLTTLAHIGRILYYCKVKIF